MSWTIFNFLVFNFEILDFSSEIVALWLLVSEDNLDSKLVNSPISFSNWVNLFELDSIFNLDSFFSFCTLESVSLTAFSWVLRILSLSSTSDFFAAASDCSVRILFLSKSINSKSALILFFCLLVVSIESLIFWIWVSISFLASSISFNSILIWGVRVSIWSSLFSDAVIAVLSISYCSIAELISMSSADFAWV